MEIILLRHGKPNVELKGKIRAVDFKQLVTAYAYSGVEDPAPHGLKERFTSYYVVCSHLKRSIHSAKKLGCKEINLSDKLFAETDIPFYERSNIKMELLIN